MKSASQWGAEYFGMTYSEYDDYHEALATDDFISRIQADAIAACLEIVAAVPVPDGPIEGVAMKVVIERKIRALVESK